jgi:hypothetical protein
MSGNRRAARGKYTLDVTLSDAAKAYPAPSRGYQGGAGSSGSRRPAGHHSPKTGDGAYFKSSGTIRSDAGAGKRNGARDHPPGSGRQREENQVIALLRSAVQRF